MIGLGQLDYLYSLLKRKNPNSDLLNENFWELRTKIDDSLRRKLLAMMFNGKTNEAEQILNDLSRTPNNLSVDQAK